MGEPKQMKKASDEQKEYLLFFMEENIDFAHDRFESTDGAHLKATKWQILTKNLNAIGGASKDVNQWRKYWRDQKLHAKEREALIKASFQISGVNGTKKVKKLSAFEERIVALLAPASISGADVPELFVLPQCQVNMRSVSIHSQLSQSIEAPDEDDLPWVVEALDDSLEENLLQEMPVTAVARPSFASTARPTPRKRKKVPSGKHSEASSFEEKILKMEAEKIFYIKKSFEMQEQSFQWKKKYEGKLLELREREVFLQEKEFQLKMQTKQ